MCASLCAFRRVCILLRVHQISTKPPNSEHCEGGDATQKYLHRNSCVLPALVHICRQSIFGLFCDGNEALPHLMRPPSPECEVVEGHWREKVHGTGSASEEQNVQYRTVEDHDREVQRLQGSMANMSHVDSSLPQDQGSGVPRDNQQVRKGMQGGAGGLARELLPIDEFKDVILGCIENSSVTCVHGETGCGKSSMVGVEVLRCRGRVCRCFLFSPAVTSWWKISFHIFYRHGPCLEPYREHPYVCMHPKTVMQRCASTPRCRQTPSRHARAPLHLGLLLMRCCMQAPLMRCCMMRCCMQVPQFIVNDAEQRGRPVKIIVTQPRRIAAVTLARRVAQQRGEEVCTQGAIALQQQQHASTHSCSQMQPTYSTETLC